jgi:hypothetical protein
MLTASMGIHDKIECYFDNNEFLGFHDIANDRTMLVKNHPEFKSDKVIISNYCMDHFIQAVAKIGVENL